MQLQGKLTFTLGSRTHKTLPCTIYIMWSMQLQSVKLICPTVRRRCICKKILYLAFDFHLGVNVTQNVAQYHLHHATYATAKFEVATSNGWEEYALTRKFDFHLGVKVTQNVAQYHLHRVIYTTAKFEVAMSNGLGGDAFTRKHIIWRLTFTKHFPVPFMSCDLCTCTIWSC